MNYFTRLSKGIVRAKQVKEMLADNTIEAYDELKKLDLCAHMCYTNSYQVALDVLKHVNSEELVGDDREYFYEVALSVYSSLGMIDNMMSILNGYAKINVQVAVEILSEYVINKHEEIENKNILEEFALKHLPADDFKDYIVMVSRYLNGDLESIKDIALQNIGRLVNIDIFHQKVYYEISLIALEAALEFENAAKLKADLAKVEPKFLEIINKYGVKLGSFVELNVFRKRRRILSKKGNLAFILWTLLLIMLIYAFI